MPLRLVQAILNEDESAFSAFFRQAGAPPASFTWRPTEADFSQGPLKFLLRHWRQLRGEAPAPNQNLIDPLDLREALGHIMILDAIDDGADFRYRVYGTKIAARTGFDMTGKRVSELTSSPVMAVFFGAAYRAVRLRCEPLMTVHSPPLEVSVMKWTRLILPLLNDDGRVERLLVGNMPGERQPVSLDQAFSRA